MATRDIIVVGASAGGVDALVQLIGRLSNQLPAAVFVVLHVPASSTSALPTILNRSGKLRAAHAGDGEPIERGRVYIAPPDRHLLVDGDAVRVVRGPTENGSRPAVDPLFRTAASRFGARVIGVVLSGSMADGTAGLHAVKAAGGLAVVQDPDEALFPGMPRSAMENVDVDHVLTILEMPAVLSRLVLETVPDPVRDAVAGSAANARNWAMIHERNGYGLSTTEPGGDEREVGEPSEFACPDCGGALSQAGQEGVLRFRCRVGHSFSAEALLSSQHSHLEEALWTALRALEENAALARRLVARARHRGQKVAIDRFLERAREAEARSALVRSVLLSGDVAVAAGAGLAPTAEPRIDELAHDAAASSAAVARVPAADERLGSE